MSMIDFPKIDSQGFFHDWNGFAMDRFNDPHLPSAGFTRRGVQAERAAEPVQSRRSACRASLLMRLSSDVRRCREELPEAARRRLPWLITAARRQAAHSPV